MTETKQIFELFAYIPGAEAELHMGFFYTKDIVEFLNNNEALRENTALKLLDQIKYVPNFDVDICIKRANFMQEYCFNVTNMGVDLVAGQVAETSLSRYKRMIVSKNGDARYFFGKIVDGEDAIGYAASKIPAAEYDIQSCDATRRCRDVQYGPKRKLVVT